MLTNEEIKKWLLGNCVNEMGNLDLSDLDFSDFDGDVFIDGMRVKKNLIQSRQEVGGFLLQNNQKVGSFLDQDYQEAAGKPYSEPSKSRRQPLPRQGGSKMTDELYFDRNVEGRSKLIKMGKCMGRDYAIVSYGTHPCAYVALLEDDTRDFEEMDALEAVNGGITFGIGCLQSDRLPPFGPKSVEAPYGVIGWDYAHGNDYYHAQGVEELPEKLAESYRELNEWRKKWTLGEIEEQVEAMCKWLNERRQNENPYRKDH